MKITMVNISLIMPYWRNPRKNADTVEELKKSIEAFGFNVPLVIDGKKVIIAGHARYRAAVEIGLKTVPCHVSDMSPELAKEYRIADNKISDLSSWIYEELQNELMDADFLKTVPGFSAEDAEGLFPTAGENDFTFDTRPDGAAGGSSAGDGGAGTGEDTEAAPEGIVALMCPHCFDEHDYKISELLEVSGESEEEQSDEG